jgi:SAM-dependent methyltransferase
MPFDDGSFDLIWSNSCFEHMRYPEITVAECVRILRPGGVIVTQVDLRDHYNMAPERSADHLLFSDRLWKAMTWNRSAYTNRLRISD